MCCDCSLPIIPCWLLPPQFWYHAKVAFVIPYCFTLLLWQAKSALCSSQPCPVMCVHMTPFLHYHFVNWVLFLHTWIDLNAHLRFVLYSSSVDECDSLPLSFASWLFAIVFCIWLPLLAQTLALSMSLRVLLFVPMTRVYHLFVWLWNVPIWLLACP